MYKNAVFRGKVTVFNSRIALLKKDMLTLLKSVRQKLFLKKIIKVQSSVRKYIMNIRFEKIKEEATKSVTKISAFYRMKKQRRKFL